MSDMGEAEKSDKPDPRRNVGVPVPAASDALDVQRAASGDQDAFERLYRGHVQRVYSLAVRMVDEDSAEDLTQEVFVRAWTKLRTFRGRSQFGTWLYRLAVNHILSRRATLSRRQAHHVSGDGFIDQVASPTMKVPGLALDIESAMKKLPERARDVFVLYDVEGFTHQEIAEMMDVSVGTSKSQLHRARMIMRDCLAES